MKLPSKSLRKTFDCVQRTTLWTSKVLPQQVRVRSENVPDDKRLCDM